MLNSFLAATFAARDAVAPDGSEPIGWLAGGVTLAFCIAGVLLMWSFVRVSRKNNAMWAEREGTESDASAGTATDGAVAGGTGTASK